MIRITLQTKVGERIVEYGYPFIEGDKITKVELFEDKIILHDSFTNVTDGISKENQA